MPMRPIGNDSSIFIVSTPSGMIDAGPSIVLAIGAMACWTIGPAIGCAKTSPSDDSRVSGSDDGVTVDEPPSPAERRSRLDAATSTV